MVKFVGEVEHRTFSGPYSVHRGQPVLYVTERCVFKLTPDGLELVEVAPGIDIERDILARMEFRPIIRNPVTMDQRIFANGPMGLRDQLLRMPIERRFTYQPDENRFFVNLEGHRVHSHRRRGRDSKIVENKLAPLGRKVYAIVNYDNFEIFPDVIDEYSAMVRDLVDRFYSGVTRYTTSSFLRAKLGEALKQRAVAPHIYERAEEATTHLRDLEQKKDRPEMRAAGLRSGLPWNHAGLETIASRYRAELGAKRCPIDGPIHSANQACTTHNIAKGDRDEIMDNPGYRNRRGVEIGRNMACLDQQPGQRQKIHVGHAVLKARRYESGDRQCQRDDLVRDRAPAHMQAKPPGRQAHCTGCP